VSRTGRKPPDFETVTLDQAVEAYKHLNEGRVRKKLVIVFPF
jgi:D-arabinose 1-dehydrogenase-like Zn-dependent alcohol dehydrogenase